MITPSTPGIELVSEISKRIAVVSRDDYEAFRAATADVFRDSGAQATITEVVSAWAAQQIETGQFSIPEAGLFAVGGAMNSAFQLGLLVGAVLYGKHNLDGATVQ